MLPVFVKYASNDESTEVRRESVSAIGRLRNEKAVPTLIEFLTDKDPKVVMQAIRGLLVFPNKSEVKQELKRLRISRAHASKRYPIPYDIHPLLIKMGWEFIDDIVWVKSEASVKNRNAGFLQHRKLLAYKPNAVSEMLMVYRKKTDKLIDWNIQQYNWDKVKKSRVVDKYETTNIWRIEPTFDRVHSAVFPLELCNRVIKYYSFIGDLIFDPFAGSGTLGRAAINLDRNFFLTEKETKYIARIKEELYKGNSLFNSENSQPNFVDTKTFISLSKREI